ncbi:MAG TPA: DUF6527 family protein [bacterium]
MAKFSPIKLSTIDDRNGFSFQCPGCGCAHFIQTNKNFKPCWGFNGNIDKPTVSPSILVRSGYIDQVPKLICHSFIKDGKIQFLGDCTHELKGKTVDLPEF